MRGTSGFEGLAGYEGARGSAARTAVVLDVISLVVMAGVLGVLSTALFARRGAVAGGVTAAGPPGPQPAREPQPGFRIVVPTPDPDAVVVARARLAPHAIARRGRPEHPVGDGER